MFFDESEITRDALEEVFDFQFFLKRYVADVNIAHAENRPVVYAGEMVDLWIQRLNEHQCLWFKRPDNSEYLLDYIETENKPYLLVGTETRSLHQPSSNIPIDPKRLEVILKQDPRGSFVRVVEDDGDTLFYTDESNISSGQEGKKEILVDAVKSRLTGTLMRVLNYRFPVIVEAQPIRIDEQENCHKVSLRFDAWHNRYGRDNEIGRFIYGWIKDNIPFHFRFGSRQTGRRTKYGLFVKIPKT